MADELVVKPYEPENFPRRFERRRVFGGISRALLHSREISIVIAPIMLVVYFQSTAPEFLSGGNVATGNDISPPRRETANIPSV
jgi:hypothetical protein